MEKVPTVEEVIQFTTQLLPGYEVLNIYVFGSRLHMCATSSSDYDCLVVVSGNYFFGSRLHENIDLNLNVSIYHVTHFQDLVSQNTVWAMFVEWLPKWCIWKETHKFNLVIKLPTLKRAVLTDCSHNFSKAKRLFTTGDIRKGKKNIIHGLRWLLLGLQIIENGSINDFTAGNIYWKEIMNDDQTDWEHFEKIYQPLYSDLMHKVKHDLESKTVDYNQEKSKTIAYLKQYGIGSLEFDFSLIITKHKDYPNLLHIKRDIASPLEESIVQEIGYSLVINSKDLSIVSITYPLFVNRFVEADDNGELLNARVYPKLDGKIAVLYHYDGRWHISSSLTADGLEYLDDRLEDHLEASKVEGTWKLNMKDLNQFRSWKVGDIEEHKECLNFKSLFWDIWANLKYKLPSETSNCYMFEIVHPKTTQIINCDSNDIILHGCRNLDTFEEYYPEEIAAKYNWHSVENLGCFTWTQIQEKCCEMDPTKEAGYIFVKQDFTRVYVPSPQYYALSNLHQFSATNTNWKLMLELVRANNNYDFMNLPKFEEWKSLFNQVKTEYLSFCNAVQEIVDKVKDSDGVVFAEETNKHAFYGLLFTMRKDQVYDVIKVCTTIRGKWLNNLIKGWKEGKKRRVKKSKRQKKVDISKKQDEC